MRLKAGSDRFQLSTPGITSTFSNLDEWEDAYDTYPTMFDQAVVSGGNLSCQCVTTPTMGGDEDTLVGHWFIAQDLGLSDNFEVVTRWTIPTGDSTISSWVGQISPVAFVDFDAADTKQMGVLPIWDVSIPATFVQNAFRNTLSDVYDPTQYTLLGGSLGRGFVPDVPGDNWLMMRVQSGSITYYWNGRRRGAAVDVPAWAEGRTKVGIHVIGTDYAIGGNYPVALGGAEVTQGSPHLVSAWYARPIG